MRTAFVATFILLSIFHGSAKSSFTEEQKIDMLINHVRTMQGAVFIRNGKDYPPKEAGDHLEMKYKKASGRIKTARQFIDHIASKSYLSGKEYMIRLPNGKIVRTKEILDLKLKEIESGK